VMAFRTGKAITQRGKSHQTGREKPSPVMALDP
jgi:hypothetical protein